MNVSQPLNAAGEQRFSSFADAKRYIDTITQTNSSAFPFHRASTAENKPPDAVTEIRVRRGDTLKNLAQQYNVSPEKLMSLNPTIRRWPAVRIGQKIVVPTAPTAAPTMTAPPVPAPSDQPSPGSSPPATTEITVVAGDSLNRLASRYNSTPDRIRELNPQITNWATILPPEAGGAGSARWLSWLCCRLDSMPRQPTPAVRWPLLFPHQAQTERQHSAIVRRQY